MADATTRLMMNDDLCEFARHWTLDGDYLRCTKCKRPHIASKADQAFVHAAGCTKASSGRNHPWHELRILLRDLPDLTQ